MSHHKACLSLFLLLTPIAAQGGGRPDEIPFRQVGGFAVVARGSIGPLRDLNLLLDTGAVPSVVSERLASRLRVGGEKGSFQLLDRSIQARYVSVSDVCLGTICASRLPMVVVDLERFERLLGLRIDAVIGLDLLAGENLTIDYQQAKITRGLSGDAGHVVPAEISFAAGAPYWTVQIELNGHTFRMLLDTGANYLGLFTRTGGRLDIAVRGMVSAAGRPLTMGDGFFRQPTSFTIEEPPLAMKDIDGILGPRALGITRIELDWKHHNLRWCEK